MKKVYDCMDPFRIGKSFQKVNQSWTAHLPELLNRVNALNQSVYQEGIHALKMMTDQRETLSSPEFDLQKTMMKQVRTVSSWSRSHHQIVARWVRSLIEDAPGLEDQDRIISMFWINQFLSALSPTNYFWTNPSAVLKFLNTGGESLIEGMKKSVEDFENDQYLARLADENAFTLGKDLAATPGRVILRNELLELIQYEPATESVYNIPIVMIQPWINKYYIFDLSPANSFVRYLISRGFTVFITSWKNPGTEMRETAFDDYLFKGILTAAEAAREICGAPGVHASGYCIGGTALTALMAWLNHEEAKPEENPIIDWTLFSTLNDFTEPGELGVFISDSGIEAIETLMKSEGGYLDARYLEHIFRMLNPDGLIWRQMVTSYLQGQEPPRSDMLFWNSDGTRLAETMCSFYLREFYLHNRLTEPGAVRLGGRSIRLDTISQPAYIVGGMQDHISPWKSTFRTGALVGKPVRYVLANEGHITGIVNPPSARSRKKYWAGELKPDDRADDWLALQETGPGSWWPDWVEWLKERSPDKVPPPTMGSRTYRPVCPAPGAYVREKSDRKSKKTE